MITHLTRDKTIRIILKKNYHRYNGMIWRLEDAKPSKIPSEIPTKMPTKSPSGTPSKIPTTVTSSPSDNPTSTPSDNPTSLPSSNPTFLPSLGPTDSHSKNHITVPIAAGSQCARIFIFFMRKFATLLKKKKEKSQLDQIFCCF